MSAFKDLFNQFLPPVAVNLFNGFGIELHTPACTQIFKYYIWGVLIQKETTVAFPRI